MLMRELRQGKAMSQKTEPHRVLMFRWPDDRRIGKVCGDPDYCHGAFMTDAGIAAFRVAHPEAQVLNVLPVNHPSLAGKFWFCQPVREGSFSAQEIISTEEAIARLARGYEIQVITGPHATRDAADASADSCWAEPDDD